VGASPAEGAVSPPALLPGLEALVPHQLPMLEARRAWIDQFEAAYVKALLARTGGNVTHAAREAHVSRRFLQSAMRRLGLRTDGEGDDPERD